MRIFPFSVAGLMTLSAGSVLLGAEPRIPSGNEALLYLHHVLVAEREIAANNLARAEELLDACPQAQRGWEWHHLKRRCQGSEISLRGAGRCAAFSPDSTLLAVGDKEIKILDAATGQVVRRFASDQVDQVGRINQVAFRPDGKQVAAINYASVVVWDTESGKPVFVKPVSGSLHSGLAYSPDGKWLAAGEGSRGKAGGIKLWDSASGKEVAHLRGHIGPVNAIAFSADGKRFVSGSEDMTIKFWDLEKGEEINTLRGHTDPVRSVAFSPDGQRLVSTSGTGVLMWNTVGFKQLYSLGLSRQRVVDASGKTMVQALPPFRSGADAAIFSPDGQRLMIGRYDGSIRIHHAAGGEELFSLQGHQGTPTSLMFGRDGRLVSADSQGSVKVWHAGTGSAVRTLLGHTNGVTSVAFSPDGRLLASCSPDHTVRIWDLAAGKDRLTVRHYDERVKGSQPVQAVLFSPNGRRLYSAGSDAHLRAWDVQTGKPLLAVKHLSPPLALSPDGQCFAAADPAGGVTLGDPESGKLLRSLSLDKTKTRVESLTFSPDGKWLAAGGGDWNSAAAIVLWEVETGKPVQSFQGQQGRVYSLTFSPDGKRLITAAGDTKDANGVLIWDTASGKLLRTLKGHTSLVTCVAMSPDGRRIASADHNDLVKVWDAELGLEILSYAGAGRFVTFSADGQCLAAAGQFWEPTRRWLGQILIYDGRPLPPSNP